MDVALHTQGLLSVFTAQPDLGENMLKMRSLCFLFPPGSDIIQPRKRYPVEEREMNFLSSILNKSALGALAVGALVALAPASAEAVTLKIEDVTSGVMVTQTDPETVNFSGTVGVFDVRLAFGTISSQGNQHVLDATSVETAGVGNLQITVTQTGLTDFGASSLNLVGTGSISNIGYRVIVRHFVDIGAGWEKIGDNINFLRAGGNSQSGTVTGSFVPDGSGVIGLRTVFDIVNTVGNTTSNINSTLVAAVPLPAGGLLLLTALGGVAALRRKRKAA